MNARIQLAMSCLLMTGCGDNLDVSLDDGRGPADAQQDLDAGPKGDRWFTESGKILALREQSGIYLDEERAEEIDELIRRARLLDIQSEGVNFENIFARPDAMMDRIYLQSTDAAMQARWERGDIETGNKELDALLISLEPSNIEPATPYLVQLWFARWADIPELEAFLNEEFSFLYASLVCHCMDGDDIELVEEENQARLTFHFKWDDCYSGCLKDHWWEIVVPHDPELPAALVAEGGTPLPP